MTGLFFLFVISVVFCTLLSESLSVMTDSENNDR